MKATKKQQRFKKHVFDPVLFGKEHISVGTQLRFMGWTDRGAAWQVVSITHYTPRRDGTFSPSKVNQPVTLGDDIKLRRVAGNPGGMNERTATLGYLIYSAAWRLA